MKSERTAVLLEVEKMVNKPISIHLQKRSHLKSALVLVGRVMKRDSILTVQLTDNF